MGETSLPRIAVGELTSARAGDLGAMTRHVFDTGFCLLDHISYYLIQPYFGRILVSLGNERASLPGARRPARSSDTLRAEENNNGDEPGHRWGNRLPQAP